LKSGQCMHHTTAGGDRPLKSGQCMQHTPAGGDMSLKSGQCMQRTPARRRQVFEVWTVHAAHHSSKKIIDGPTRRGCAWGPTCAPQPQCASGVHPQRTRKEHPHKACMSRLCQFVTLRRRDSMVAASNAVMTGLGAHPAPAAGPAPCTSKKHSLAKIGGCLAVALHGRADRCEWSWISDWRWTCSWCWHASIVPSRNKQRSREHHMDEHHAVLCIPRAGP